MFCRFTCPVTGRSVSASAELRPLPQKRDAEQEFKAGVLGGLRRSLASVLGGVLGSSEHADARAEMAAADPAGDGVPVDADEQIRRYAITRAFRSVSSLFRWEGEQHRWVAVDAGEETLTRFESHLAVHPVRDTKDLAVLLRMLVAIARADGHLDEEEERFLALFAVAGGRSLEDLVAESDPSSAEVGAVDRSRRESVLMICWAGAYSDGSLESHERDLLARYAADLGISAETVTELRNRAQNYLLERTLEDVFSDFAMNVEEEDLVVRMGQKLGLTLAETENAIARFRKRRGLA